MKKPIEEYFEKLSEQIHSDLNRHGAGEALQRPPEEVDLATHFVVSGGKGRFEKQMREEHPEWFGKK